MKKSVWKMGPTADILDDSFNFFLIFQPDENSLDQESKSTVDNVLFDWKSQISNTVNQSHGSFPTNIHWMHEFHPCRLRA